LPRYLLDPAKANGPAEKKGVAVRVAHKVCNSHKQRHRAEPGERELPTKLYDPWCTPHKQLGDFGLGIGLYFSTLKALTVLTFLAGILNIPNLAYYSSFAYSAGQVGVSDLLKGTTICTETTWVPCPDCSVSNSSIDLEPSRVAYAIDGISNEQNLTFALANDCDGATFQQGMINWGTLMLVLAGAFVINWYLKRSEVEFDEDEQTAQDYSVVIENPPSDATDPEEWRAYFRDCHGGAQVTACTVGVDNDLLVRYLVERRVLLRKIEMMVEPGTSLDKLTLANLAAKEERSRKVLGRLMALFVPGVPEMFSRFVVVTAKLQGLAQQEYPATNVFVTFETETDQRRVLAALNYAPLDTLRNNKSAVLESGHLFRGERLLAVREPDEPNTIRWEDLNVKLKDRMKQQFLTLVATLGGIALVAFVIRLCHNANLTFSAFAIAIFNVLFPMFAKALNSLESHPSEGSKQRSLYLKIALFRWYVRLLCG